MLLPCANAAVYTWDGSGTPNNGGNWSTSANWDPDGVPDGYDDTATLLSPGATRTVTNDVDRTVGALTMGSVAANRLVLAADLTVSNLNAHWEPTIEMNGHTLTVWQRYGSLTYMPNFTGGGGLFVKVGPGVVYSPNTSSGYSGDYIISNGLFRIGGGVCGQGGSANMTIRDGARVEVYNPNQVTAFPSNLVIHGDGGGQGVIRNNYQAFTYYPDLIVASDALIVNAVNATATLQGDIHGPGVLTLTGNGNEDCTFTITGTGSTYSNKLVVTNVNVLLQADLHNITNIWIDAGGVFKGLQSQFPLATVVETNGGVWIQATSATWTGGGDGSNWTDTANWSPSIVPSNTATIGSPPSLRTVVVDAPSYIETLELFSSANNRIRLDADLTVSNFVTSDQAYMELNGNTLTVSSSSGVYLPNFTGGGGLFVKVGPGVCGVPNNSVGYSGNYVISNGLFNMAGGATGRGGSTNMTIHDGARVRIAHDPFGTGLFPSNVVIYGNGGGLGVLDNDKSAGIGGALLNFYPDLNVASAALIRCEDGKTMKLWGDISGLGDTLTLDGLAPVGGAFELAGQNSAYAKKLIVTNSTVTIAGNLPNITNIWVDAGGVLEGLQSQFPLATVVETNGGVWVKSQSATWTGAGDGSNWTDTANWTPQIIPSETATIPDLGPLPSTVVVVDTATNINTLALAPIASCVVRLAADLTVSNVSPMAWQAFMELNGNTLTIWEAAGTYLPNFRGGGGLFVKVGPGSCYSPNTTHGYTGDFVISNGTFTVGGGLLGQGGSTNLTVHDGATVVIYNDGLLSFPSNVVIHGNGGTGDGAIRNGNRDDFYPDITVASDALIYNDTALTLTLHGDITGPGDLTLESVSGDYDLDGTYNFVVSGADANSIIADTCDVDISDATLVLTADGIPSQPEYVVIDYSAGTLSGEFADVNLPTGWLLTYDGTSSNPDCVVVERPPPGSMILLR